MARREQKYPDTEYFHFYNANDKNRIGGDCVVRAIATALEQSWEKTVRELTEVGIKYGLVLNDKKCYEKYLAQKGWVKHSQPRHRDNTKYTGKEFCEVIQDYLYEDELLGQEWDDGIIISGNIIAHIGGHHIVAIEGGKVWDIWNSTGGCIGNYWTKP